MYIFLICLLFWSVIYLVDAYADSKVSKIISLANHIDSYETNILSGLWHNSRLIFYLLFHLLYAYTIFLYFGLFILAIGQLLLSISVKAVIRGTALSIFLDIPLFEFHCNGKWDFFDCFLVWVHKKISIHPAVIMYLQFILFSLLYLWSFKIISF